MLRTARFMKIGVPAILAVVALLAMSLWAFGPSALGGENAFIKTNVEWKVFGPDGSLKLQGVGHNATTSAYLEAAASRLSAAGTLDETTNYDNVALCSGTAGTPTDCSADNLVDLNGVAALAGGNPVDQTPSNPTGTGNYAVANTFTCNTDALSGGLGSACTAITQLQLSMGAVTDGTGHATTAVGAYKNVAITLADDDTLEVTWTITVS